MAGHCVRVFLGFDERMPVGVHACVQSLIDHATVPVAVTPLRLSNLKSHFRRPKAPGQLTDFTFSRFIVPHLCEFQGWALFIDGSDMMFRGDVAELWNLRDDKYGVMLVKHPEFDGKHSFMDKKVQSYPMLNWSSVMLFNNSKCSALTQEYVETADYFDLNQFKWLSSDAIGELPDVWNHLVGYYELQPDAKLVHWTLGTPAQGGKFATAEYAEEWFQLKDRITRVEDTTTKAEEPDTNGKTNEGSADKVTKVPVGSDLFTLAPGTTTASFEVLAGVKVSRKYLLDGDESFTWELSVADKLTIDFKVTITCAQAKRNVEVCGRKANLIGVDKCRIVEERSRASTFLGCLNCKDLGIGQIPAGSFVTLEFDNTFSYFRSKRIMLRLVKKPNAKPHIGG